MPTQSILTDKDFKLAIHAMSTIQKDKLILRLLRKDPILTRQLHFELVDTESADEKLEKAMVELQTQMKANQYNINDSKQLIRFLRYLSRDINLHAKVYKSKWAEVRLNCSLLLEMLIVHRQKLISMDHWEDFNLFLYIIQKLYRLLMQIDSIDPDYYVEIRDDMEQIGQSLQEIGGLQWMCAHTQFNPKWCIEGSWPNPLKPLYDQIKPTTRMYLTRKRKQALSPKRKI